MLVSDHFSLSRQRPQFLRRNERRNQLQHNVPSLAIVSFIGERERNVFDRFAFPFFFYISTDNILHVTNMLMDVDLPAAREPRLRTHPAYFYARSESRPKISRWRQDLFRSGC